MRKIPLAKPFFDNKDIEIIKQNVSEILKGGRLILGKYTEKFENDFKQYYNKDFAIAVNTCTTALTICLDYIGIEGKDVILPSNTFVTDANSIIQSKGKLIFAEMDPNTLCLDIEDVKKKISNNTKAIIMIHMLGMIDPKIYELAELCKKKNIFLIEDCSHAHGSLIDGKKVGAFGDVSCFSFYPTKIMTTGLGGMIITNDKNLEKYAKSLRLFGSGQNLDEIVHMGNDWMLTEINACLGIQQLKKLENNIIKRNLIAKKYKDDLVNVDKLKIFEIPNNIRHSYYRFPLLLSEKIDRDLLIKKMKEKYNIETSGVYTPCHLHPLYRKFGYRDGMFPVTEDILKKVICLPIFPQLSDENVEYVIRSLIQELT